MKPSDELFNLIKSFTPSEKKYFKVFASKHIIKNQNEYVRLFDIIDKQTVYDETVVKNIFLKGKKEKSFKITKNYLQTLILKSLASYPVNDSVKNELDESVKQAGFLLKKGATSLGIKIISRAKVKAQKAGSLIHLLYLKQLETELYKGPERVKKLEEMIEVSTLYTRGWELRVSYSKLVVKLNTTTLIRKQSDLELIEQFAKKHIDYKYSINKLTYQDKFFLMGINGFYYFIAENYSQSFLFFKKQSDLIKEQMRISYNDHVFHYLLSLANLLNVSLYLDTEKNQLEIKQALENIPYQFPRLASKKKVLSFISGAIADVELEKALKMYDFKLAAQLAEKSLSSEEEKLYFDHIPTLRMHFYYKAARSYHGMGDYRKALYWCNIFLKEPKADTHHEMFSWVKMLTLILHFELKNFDYLPYAIESTMRFLKQHGMLYKTEASVIKFIESTMEELSFQKLAPLLSNLKKELFEIFSDPLEKKSLNYFGFITWLDASLVQKTIQEYSSSQPVQ